VTGVWSGGRARQPLAQGRIIIPGTERQLGTYGLFPPSPAQQRTLTPTRHQLTAKNAEPELLWISFAELCGGTASLADYGVLAGQHSTWVIDGVPAPGADLPDKSTWLRFGGLVDALCERGVTLFLIGPDTLDWEGAAAALKHAQGAADAELAEVMARTARHLSLLARVESAGGQAAEGVSGS
jgi:predicted ATPase